MRKLSERLEKRFNDLKPTDILSFIVVARDAPGFDLLCLYFDERSIPYTPFRIIKQACVKLPCESLWDLERKEYVKFIDYNGPLPPPVKSLDRRRMV